MSLKKAYQYLFYKLYKFFQSIPYPWWSEWKALGLICLLFIFIILAVYVYLKLMYFKYLDLTSNRYYLILLFASVYLVNLYLLFYKDKWKEIVKDFDQLPNKKNRLGGWLVLVFVILVFANLFYSFYLMSQIDWSQYR